VRFEDLTGLLRLQVVWGVMPCQVRSSHIFKETVPSSSGSPVQEE